MFFGEYQHTVDTKGRMIIPAQFRDELGSGFIVMRGIEECLFVYPGTEFEKFSQKFAGLPTTDRDAQAYIRLFMSSMTRQDFDGQGRILIPAPLRKYAGLEKDATVIGVLNRVEIWSRDKWEAYNASSSENFNRILTSMTNLGV